MTGKNFLQVPDVLPDLLVRLGPIWTTSAESTPPETCGGKATSGAREARGPAHSGITGRLELRACKPQCKRTRQWQHRPSPSPILKVGTARSGCTGSRHAARPGLSPSLTCSAYISNNILHAPSCSGCTMPTRHARPRSAVQRPSRAGRPGHAAAQRPRQVRTAPVGHAQPSRAAVAGPRASSGVITRGGHA